MITANRRCTRLAKEFVLADNFFQGAFGGSFLNHQYLICACAPVYPNADTAAAKPSIAMLEQDAAGHYLPRLKQAKDAKLSALDEPPRFREKRQHHAGQLFRRRQVLRGEHHAAGVSAERQQAGGRSMPTTLFADPDNPTTLPPQNQAHHRRRAGCQAASIGFGMRAPGTRRSRMAARSPSKARTAIYAPDDRRRQS